MLHNHLLYIIAVEYFTHYCIMSEVEVLTINYSDKICFKFAKLWWMYCKFICYNCWYQDIRRYLSYTQKHNCHFRMNAKNKSMKPESITHFWKKSYIKEQLWCIKSSTISRDFNDTEIIRNWWIVVLSLTVEWHVDIDHSLWFVGFQLFSNAK